MVVVCGLNFDVYVVWLVMVVLCVQVDLIFVMDGGQCCVFEVCYLFLCGCVFCFGEYVCIVDGVLFGFDIFDFYCGMCDDFVCCVVLIDFVVGSWLLWFVVCWLYIIVFFLGFQL